MIRKLLHSALIITAMAAPFLLGGCSDAPDDAGKDPINGEYAKVAISISSRSLGSGTRADGTPQTPASANEKIKDWWLAFVENSGKVAKTLKREDAEGTSSDPVEQETFKCIIPAGTYDIYAFANISQDKLSEATGLDFSKSLTKADIEAATWIGLRVSDFDDTEENDTDGRVAVESATALGAAYDAKVNSVSNYNLNLWDASEDNGNPIPMTGILREVKIENTIEETFSIEVVRMVAKVELQFKNPGTTPVTIKAVGFSPVTVTPVSLFPTYDVLGESAFTPLANAEYARLKHNTGSITVPGAVNGSAGTNSYSFYIKESLSNVTGSFTVWLEVGYQNGATELLQFSPTQDIRDYINRNDWIQIPVSLSDYDVKVEAVFYPPIGGYPAINEGKDPDGAQEFTFGTPGKFAIMPYVTDKMTGEPVAYEHYRLEVDEIRYSPKPENATGNWKRPDWLAASLIYSSDSEKTVATDKGIFAKMPVSVEVSSTALPYEMLGELNENQGIAKVTLKVKVYEGNFQEGSTPKHTYTRWLYIIRENKTTNNQD